MGEPSAFEAKASEADICCDVAELLPRSGVAVAYLVCLCLASPPHVAAGCSPGEVGRASKNVVGILNLRERNKQP